MKLRSNRLFFRILYPLDINQSQAVVGQMFLIKNVQFSAESDFSSVCFYENFKQSGLSIDYWEAMFDSFKAIQTSI